MLNEDQQRRLHRRWLITGIIALAIVILLHLWFIVAMFFLIWLGGATVVWFIDWIVGADLNGGDRGDDNMSNEERTMWDIFTMHEVMDHHHDNWNQK